MKRTIVALAALVMLAAAGSANAEAIYKNINLDGLFIQTFQGPTTGTPISGLCALSFDGISSIAGSQCYIIGSTRCLQNLSGTYTVSPSGTGTISGTLAAGGGPGCPGTTTPFNESFVIEQLNYLGPNDQYQALNVFFTRTDLGYVASGTMVPQGGATFQNNNLNGTYDELISGTTGGNSFTEVCQETFNGAGNVFAPQGTVTGSCTINTAGIGACNYSLSGKYAVAPNASADNSGTLTLTSGAGGCASSLNYAELMRILDGTFNGPVFEADQIVSVSLESGVTALGTYLPQE